MTVAQILGAVQLGLIYGLMGLGLYIPFRVLDIPDMTTQGSFTLGMVVAGAMTLAGHPVLGLLVSLAAGAAAGVVTGILHSKWKISAILSGILTMTALYTVNLLIMGGKANISLIGKGTVFSGLEVALGNSDLAITLLSFFIVVLWVALLAVFFHTRTGLTLRATGDNEMMVRHTSIDTDLMKILGLAMGNALAAFSGALICHYNVSADVNSSNGILVVGLASIIIGETLFKRDGVTRGLISTILGSILYRLMIAAALKFDILPSYALNLISTVIVIAALMFPSIQRARMRYRKKVRHRRLVEKWMKSVEEEGHVE